MGNFLCRIFCLAVLVGAVSNFSIVFRSSPAFNDDQRRENVVGGWRVPNAAAHYDKAEYLLELGYTYLNEIGVTFDPVTEEPTVIGIEELQERTDKALDLIGQSLRLDPANASGWAYLAQAQGRNAAISDMRESLERSWSLAPNNLQLAPLRLQLLLQVHQTALHSPERVEALSDQEIAAARRDFQVLNARSPNYLEFLIPEADPVRALLSDPVALNSGT